MTEISNSPDVNATEDRRKFLATCGKFAVVTPPAITMLLSTSLTSDAMAKSGVQTDPGDNGGGNNNNNNNNNHQH